MTRLLMAALASILCGCSIEGKRHSEIRRDCVKIGYASDNARIDLIGYKCPDSLEYWIPRPAR